MDISSALSAVKGTLDRVLDKNLQDLVRYIRNHKDDEAKYIGECLEEIKVELRNENLAVKANAVNKLIYLQMLGCDINWAAFNIIEVMSSTKFTHKRISYLAASQTFHNDTDVLMLATNIIKKDLNSNNIYFTTTAISGLACFINEDMARDLHTDITMLMNSNKPYVRKRAVLLMYKVFLRYPEALRTSFAKLREKLDDPDQGVQAAAVNVICELARKNPQHYLSLSPVFFQLMTTSTNNWVLIKIIKLFGALTPFEPRLGKKLIGPLTNLIHNTSAMSLLYECINTVLAGIPNHEASIQLCVQKLRVLIEDSDQNLKYLGLLAMIKILRHHPKSVQCHKDLVLNCLDDRDESIRLRALDLLLHGLTNKKNLVEIIRTLLRHAGNSSFGAHYKAQLLEKIIQICSQNDYQLITNFEWYISVLIQLAQTSGVKSGSIVAAQLFDVSIRVESVREFAVDQMSILLENNQTLAKNSKQNSILEILHAAAWICAEYSNFLKNPRITLESMLTAATLKDLDSQAQSLLLSGALKLFCKFSVALVNGWKENSYSLEDQNSHAILLVDSLLDLTNGLIDKFAMFVHSSDLEVQERAVSIHQLFSMVAKQLNKIRINSNSRIFQTCLEKPSESDYSPMNLLEQRLGQACITDHSILGNEDASTIMENSILDELDGENKGPILLALNDEVSELIAVEPTFENVKCIDDVAIEATARSSSTCSIEKSAQESLENYSKTSTNNIFNFLKPIVKELSCLFAGEVNPVTTSAQKKVPIPDGLNLDIWINEPPSNKKGSDSELDPVKHKKKKKLKNYKHKDKDNTKQNQSDIFEIYSSQKQKSTKTIDCVEEQLRQERIKEREKNPHYLKSSPVKNPASVTTTINSETNSIKASPIHQSEALSTTSTPIFEILTKPDQLIHKNNSERKVKKRKEEKEFESPEKNGPNEGYQLNNTPVVKKIFDLPDNALEGPDSDEYDKEKNNDLHARLNIVLDDMFQTEQFLSQDDNARKFKKKSKHSTEKTSSKYQQDNFKMASKIDKEKFSEILSQSENPSTSCRASSKYPCPASKLVIENGNISKLETVFTQLLNRISDQLPCQVVDRINLCASLYSIDVQSSCQVFMLLKINASSGSVSVDVKSATDFLSSQYQAKLKYMIKSFRDS